MRRSRTFALLILGLALGLIAAAATAVGSHDHSPGKIVRWDLVQIQQDTVLGGGTTVSTDPHSGASISLTGTGHARPHREEAFGGGTFVHEDGNGNEIARGVYQVTGFVSWERLSGGSLPPTLADGIGDRDEASSGILKMTVHFAPQGGGDGVDAIMEVHCSLPGTVHPTVEGVVIWFGDQRFDVDPDRGGVTLFHVMR